MIYIPLDSKPPSIEERANIMRRHISKGGVPVDYDRLIEYLAHSRVEQDELGNQLLRDMHSNDGFFSPSTFKLWVKRTNLKMGFNLTPTGNISFDDESIKSFISTNAYGDEITNIVKKYRTYAYLGGQVLQLPSIIQQYQPTGLESGEGRRVILIKPGVEVQNTGRFGLVNPAFMNLPRYMKDLVVAPRGWTIMSADSGQIEPKIIYGFYIPDKQIQKLIADYKDAYFAILHYCTMPQSDFQNQTMEFKLMEITPDLVELRTRLKTYGNAIMYGATSNRENDPLKESYIQRIGQHPLRVEWQRKLTAKLDSGQRLFPTIFGTPMDVYNSKKVKEAKDEGSRRLALIHCIINNPIQGTAADCMGFAMRNADHIIATRAPNSWITKFVHDELQCCIHNDEKDYVMEDLMECTSYDLGGVVQIYNDPSIGRKINPTIPYSYAQKEIVGGIK